MKFKRVVRGIFLEKSIFRLGQIQPENEFFYSNLFKGLMELNIMYIQVWNICYICLLCKFRIFVTTVRKRTESYGIEPNRNKLNFSPNLCRTEHEFILVPIRIRIRVWVLIWVRVRFVHDENSKFSLQLSF